jgi:hypothetical protein
MKTIFYKLITDKENADYWFDDTPAKEWFILENFLYEPNGNVAKRVILPEGENKYIHSLSVNKSQDTFSDDGIVRRLGLYCYKF